MSLLTINNYISEQFNVDILTLYWLRVPNNPYDTTSNPRNYTTDCMSANITQFTLDHDTYWCHEQLLKHVLTHYFQRHHPNQIMTLRSETSALNNMPVNPYSLMAWTMEHKSTQTTTSGGIQCKKTKWKGQ